MSYMPDFRLRSHGLEVTTVGKGNHFFHVLARRKGGEFSRIVNVTASIIIAESPFSLADSHKQAAG